MIKFLTAVSTYVYIILVTSLNVFPLKRSLTNNPFLLMDVCTSNSYFDFLIGFV